MSRAFVSAFALASLLAANAHAADPPRFEVTARGPTVQASLGMSRAGYRLFADLGGESAGIRSFGRHWLVSWNVLAAGRLGVLANREPYLYLFGIRGSSMVEAGYRLLDSDWSPIVSGRLAGDLGVLWNSEAPLSELRTQNDMDGVGGVTARGLVRLGAGGSYLARGKSLVLQGFAQEALVAHGQNHDGKAFTEVGVAGRFDWTWGLSAALELSAGTTLVRGDDLLGRDARTTRLGAAGSARKIFPNGMWLTLFVSIAQESDHVTYRATQATFDTQSPADFTMGLGFGFSLWRPR